MRQHQQAKAALRVPMTAAFFRTASAVAALMMSASLALAQSPSLSDLPKENGHPNAAQAFSCTDVHTMVCMAYCKSNNPGPDCTLDCDGRRKECMGTGAYLIRRFSKTYVVNLRKE